MLNASRVKSIVGNRFGSLTVDSLHHITKQQGHSYWFCICDCGNTVIARGSHLKSGNVTSCGCARGTHHGSGTRLYNIWLAMRERCFNKNCPAYASYGRRGISVCYEWSESFELFRDWSIANGYNDNLSIDRINNNGSYSPENCRWATPREQANNTRRNRLLTFNGKTLSLTEWARRLGIKQSTLSMRITTYHWPIERALTKGAKI